MAEKIDFTSVSYVLGILSIVMAFFVPLGSLIIGIIGYTQSKKARSKKAKRLNVVGIILSIIFLVISIFTLFYSNGAGIFPGV